MASAKMSKATRMALAEKEERERRELAECSFTPTINRKDPVKAAKLRGIGKSDDQFQISLIPQKGGPIPVEGADHYLEQIVENNVPKTMPKGYAK